ncbi:MAG: 50S ribosomal protein L30e [Desulfurococcaceae archaeon]
MSAAPKDVGKEIVAAYRTGKVVLGTRRTTKLLLLGKVKAVVVASNAPRNVVESLKYYSKLSGTTFIEFGGTNVELGTLLGKPFGVSVLGVIDPGQSRLLEIGGSSG